MLSKYSRLRGLLQCVVDLTGDTLLGRAVSPSPGSEESLIVVYLSWRGIVCSTPLSMLWFGMLRNCTWSMLSWLLWAYMLATLLGPEDNLPLESVTSLESYIFYAPFFCNDPWDMGEDMFYINVSFRYEFLQSYLLNFGQFWVTINYKKGHLRLMLWDVVFYGFKDNSLSWLLCLLSIIKVGTSFLWLINCLATGSRTKKWH